MSNKFTPEDAGCYLSGHMGWHNSFRVVNLAIEHGMELDESDQVIIDDYNTHGSEIAWSPSDENFDAVSGQGGMADMATDYLTLQCPDGYLFMWDAGELIMCSEEEAQDF